MRRKSVSLAWIIALGPVAAAPAEGPDPSTLTLERIITNDEFRTEHFGPARWLEDGSGYTTLEPAADGKGRDIVRHDPGSGRREVLVAASKLVAPGASEPLSIDDYSWSKDGKRLLIFTNTRKVWRQNTRGDYWVFDRDGGRLQKLGGSAPEASMMFAKFSPDGRRVAYVRGANLYVEEIGEGNILTLTSDGSAERINGTFDWVYEEEFSLRDGFRWSPDGRSIAYWQMDNSGMKDYVLVDTTTDLYPRLTTIRYPKVGQVNPSSRVGVVPSGGRDPVDGRPGRPSGPLPRPDGLGRSARVSWSSST